MKSPEVYSLLKSELAPWFKSGGFKRAKGFLGWSRPHGDAHTVVWCQVSQSGWDRYAGSGFVVEFQRSPDSVIGGLNARRERFSSFLSPEEREDVRRIQNQVIAELHVPPASYPVLHVAQQVTDIYLKQFKTVTEPYPRQHDIWFRYASPEHVIRWAGFILGKLPAFISVVEGWPEQSIRLPPS
jgi:hypothetical protein